MSVYKAINEITVALTSEGIKKKNTNKQQGYAFRGIDDVMNTLAPLLGKHGLVVLPRVTSREVTERTSKHGGVLFYVVLTVEFDFVSADDGTTHTVITMGEAMDSGDKATNKAMSAAYKYACLQAFCVPTESVDADAETHEVEPPSQPAVKPTAVPAESETPLQKAKRKFQEQQAKKGA